MKDLKQVAKWLNMGTDRVYQIISFLLLAPSIQEEILLSKDETLFSIPEYKIHQLIREANWTKQQEIWMSLINKPS